MAFTNPGVRLEFASNIIATAPVTTGAATDVPLMYIM